MSNPKCPHCGKDITFVEVRDTDHGVLNLEPGAEPDNKNHGDFERLYFCPWCDNEIEEEFVTKIITPCEHDWNWSYDCFEDAKILELDNLGIPVKCSICGITGIEWFSYSNVQINKE